MLWDDDEDTDVTEVPLRPPAPAVIRDTPRDPTSGEQRPVRARAVTRPYDLRGGRLVLTLRGGGEP